MPKNNEGTSWLKDFRHRLIFELYVSYLYARQGGKRATFDEHKFEAFEFYNLHNLAESMADELYKPSRGTAHVIFNPVIREIFAASFRDRVLHHWVYIMIYDWWDKQFVLDSYSCREAKGTLFGIMRLQEQIQQAMKQFGEPVWVVKLDIKGYFMSIDHEKLWEVALDGLKKQFEGDYGVTYQMLKFCLHEIIFDEPCKGVKRRGWPQDWRNLPKSKSLFFQMIGIGIVIGNLTSQLLSNIFLNQLDKFVTETLGYKFYGRYVDDFYFIVPKSQLGEVDEAIKAIENFLKGIGLTLHPDKRSIKQAERGVAFLGAVVYPTVIHPGKRLKRRTRKAFRDFVNGKASIETIVSYVGHMRYMKHDKFLSKVCDEVGLPRDFWKQYEKPVDETRPSMVLLRERQKTERETASLKRELKRQTQEFDAVIKQLEKDFEIAGV